MSHDPAQRGPRHGGEVASQHVGGPHGALGSWARARPRLVDAVVALLVFTYNLPIPGSACLVAMCFILDPRIGYST